MMTKDKNGNYCFKEGKEYKIRSFVNPVWMPGSVSTCKEVRSTVKPGTDTLVEGGEGLFSNGDDTRWWAATDQFEEV